MLSITKHGLVWIVKATNISSDRLALFSSCCMDERNNAGHPSSKPPSEVNTWIITSLGGLLEG
jgi:hypothetical protein